MFDVCSCGMTYVGETEQNVEVRWFEHNNPTKKSKPPGHILELYSLVLT